MNTTLKKNTVPLAITFAGLLLSAIIMGTAYAQTGDTAPAGGSSEPSISFPVAELGNCASKSDCKAYCDQPGNSEACLSFAEKNGLMPKEEIETAKKFMAAGGKGPGGCTGKDSCEAFCDNIENIDTCVSFAEQSGIMPPKELEEAKKVQAAIKRGVKPPACSGKKSCDAYCEDANHIEECVAFASAAGFMSPEEAANAQKMVQAIKSGVKPLACRGKEECDAYCGQEEHMDECVAFAEAAGFMSKDDAAMARKTGGKGPGGCKGKNECEAFCSNPDNEETCFNFGKDNGLIPPEELQKMEEGNRGFRDQLSNAPPEIADCLTNSLGADNIEKIKNGTMRPSRALGDKMGVCFKQFENQRIQQEEAQLREGESRRGPGSGGTPNEPPPQYDPQKGGPPPTIGPNGEQGMMPPNGGQRFDPRCENGGCQGEQGNIPREGQAPNMERRPLEGRGAFERPAGDFQRSEAGSEGGIMPIIQRVEGILPADMVPQYAPNEPAPVESVAPATSEPAPSLAPAPTSEPAPAPGEPAPAQGSIGLASPDSMVGSVLSIFNRILFGK